MTRFRDDEVLAVAKTMTEVEPSADLEARIKARIDASSATRRPALVWRLAVPLGAVAAVAIVTLVVQGPESKVQGPSSRHLDSSSSRHLETSPSRSLATSPSRSLAISKSRNLAASEVELAWMERRIPALASIQGLEIARLGMESIQPEPLSITPLSVTPLVTSPVNGDADSGRQQND